MPKNRWQILVDLLQARPHGAGAEIGVFEGDTTVQLLRNLRRLKVLYCVDAFTHYPEHTATLNPNKPKFHDADFDRVAHTFKNRVQPYVASHQIHVLNLFSEQAAPMVPDASLDFVFIDANHAYEYVTQDIALWLPKVRPGGLLTGHDYGVRGARKNFGVTRAVQETFGKNYGNIRHVWYHEVV